jgi:hypothetical protein
VRRLVGALRGIVAVPLAGVFTFALVLFALAVVAGALVTPFQIVRQLRNYASTGLDATADV